MPYLPPRDRDPEESLLDRSSQAYHDAFADYMRYGTPIPSSLEVKAEVTPQQERTTTHYTWRTQGDGKVRASHRANDGKIFAWDKPPKTGHPGEAPGCRCRAEPYTAKVNEFFNIRLQNVSDSGRAWETRDYVKHYFFGNGRGVTLRETGNLVKVVAEYNRQVIDDPQRLRGKSPMKHA